MNLKLKFVCVTEVAFLKGLRSFLNREKFQFNIFQFSNFMSTSTGSKKRVYPFTLPQDKQDGDSFHPTLKNVKMTQEKYISIISINLKNSISKQSAERQSLMVNNGEVSERNLFESIVGLEKQIIRK